MVARFTLHTCKRRIHTPILRIQAAITIIYIHPLALLLKAQRSQPVGTQGYAVSPVEHAVFRDVLVLHRESRLVVVVITVPALGY